MIFAAASNESLFLKYKIGFIVIFVKIVRLSADLLAFYGLRFHQTKSGIRFSAIFVRAEQLLLSFVS